LKEVNNENLYYQRKVEAKGRVESKLHQTVSAKQLNKDLNISQDNIEEAKDQTSKKKVNIISIDIQKFQGKGTVKQSF